jgi:tellurite resistance protein
VRDLVLACMISITLADGEIEEPEIEGMAEAYAEIMGQPPEQGELRELALVSQEAAAEAGRLGTQGPFEALLERLGKELPLLDDNGRELILESAFRVACADGEIEPEEYDQLRAIANALAINEGVLELEIARFQRQMAR